ncbi:c-type cytochrome [Frateuria aurantia]
MAVRLIAVFVLWASASLVTAATVSPWGGRPDVGKTRVAVCSACHGLDGQATTPIYPSLAGQHETYIVDQLKNFKLGHRVNPIMLAMSQTLSDQDMHDIGAYYAAQPPHAAAASPLPSDLAAGAQLYRGGDRSRRIPACAACHGPDGRGNPASGFPLLQGQSAVYLVARLSALQQARLPPGHPRADIMPTVARQLTAADIQALADYLQQLDEPPSH